MKDRAKEKRLGLRQRELCERFGCDYRKVAAIAKQKNLSTHDYIQDQTGWVLYEELYYPPGAKITELKAKEE